MIKIDWEIRFVLVFPDIIDFLGSLGSSFMMPGSAGSTPRARAGKASVTRFSHKSWIGVRGLGLSLIHI